MAIPLGDVSRENQVSKTKDRTGMDEVRNEDVQRRTGVMRVGW